MAGTDDLEFLRTMDHGEMRTTEIAKIVGMSRRRAQIRLEKLVEEGLVSKRGKQIAHWSLTDDGRELMENSR